LPGDNRTHGNAPPNFTPAMLNLLPASLRAQCIAPRLDLNLNNLSHVSRNIAT
jgi:hypothetical protein